MRVGLVGDGQTQKLGSFWKHGRRNTKEPGGRHKWDGWTAGRVGVVGANGKETQRPEPLQEWEHKETWRMEGIRARRHKET